MKGWISLYRQIQGHCFYPLNEERKFTRLEAWIDLLLNANHTDAGRMVQDKYVEIKRGTMVIAHVQLAKKWKWDRGTVKKFLTLLKDLGMIKLEKINPKNTKSCTLLKINNYNYFQDNLRIESARKSTRKPAREPAPINNDNNENKYSENYKKFKTVDLLKYARKM